MAGFFCRRCGSAIPSHSRFCFWCGEPVGAPGNLDEYHWPKPPVERYPKGRHESVLKRPDWFGRRSLAEKAGLLLTMVALGALVVVGVAIGTRNPEGRAPLVSLTTTTSAAQAVAGVAVTPTSRVATSMSSGVVTSTMATTTTSQETTTTTESVAAYQEKCRQIDYDVLARDPDAHTGEFLRFTGQVYQILTKDGVTMMLLHVSHRSGGYWDDAIFVRTEGTVEARQDDIVWVWGECIGTYTYTSVENTRVSLPGLEAKYVARAE